MNNTHILLGMKKRGFGEGNWNGFGGKVLPNESIEDGAKRELKEESGIIATHLTKKARLQFSFENNPLVIDGHVFVSHSHHGTPIETEEMKPKWFAHHDIPFHAMWQDDHLWLPDLIAGKFIYGKFHFDNVTLIRHNVQTFDTHEHFDIYTQSQLQHS